MSPCPIVIPTLALKCNYMGHGLPTGNKKVLLHDVCTWWPLPFLTTTSYVPVYNQPCIANIFLFLFVTLFLLLLSHLYVRKKKNTSSMRSTDSSSGYLFKDNEASICSLKSSLICGGLWSPDFLIFFSYCFLQNRFFVTFLNMNLLWKMSFTCSDKL